MFVPEILRPEPDPFFVRELRKIDPDLRVVFGYETYLVRRWAIERKLPPERYFALYASLFEQGLSRFVEQPIFDTNQPIFDEDGTFVTYQQVGSRRYDLAPEYECVAFVDSLDSRILTDLRRAYAWERNHPISRMAFEKKLAEEQFRAKQAARNLDIGMEALKDAFRENGQIVQFGQPKQVMEGTEL